MRTWVSSQGLISARPGREDVGVGGEVADEGGLVAVGDDGDLARGLAGDAVEHGGKAAKLGHFHGDGAAALGDDDESDAGGGELVFQVNALADAGVFDGEAVGGEAVDGLALFGADLDGDEDEVGLGGEAVGGRRRAPGAFAWEPGRWRGG